MAAKINNTVLDNSMETAKTSFRLDSIEEDIKAIKKDLQVKGAESTKTFSDIWENIRLMRQEIAHLKGISLPQFWESEILGIKDIVYKSNNQIIESEGRIRRLIENHFVNGVIYSEMLDAVKRSGVTLKELADYTSSDISTISRVLNGNKKKQDTQLFAKIKLYCLEKMAKNK